MHELGLTGRVVADIADQAGGRTVTRVTLGIPPDADPELMAATWAHASRGTVAEGAAVTWIEVAHLLRCLDCRDSYRGNELDRCPTCGGDGLVIERTGACELVDLAWEDTNVPR